MAHVLKLSKKAARALIVNVARSDQTKDLRVSMKYRKLHRKVEACAKDYFRLCDEGEKKIANARLEYPADSAELAEVIRKALKEQESAVQFIKDDPAKDEHSDGILLENEEFNFLKSKIFEMKGIPSEGEGGEVWEEIFEELENSKEVKIKVVEPEKEPTEATGG